MPENGAGIPDTPTIMYWYIPRLRVRAGRREQSFLRRAAGMTPVIITNTSSIAVYLPTRFCRYTKTFRIT